MQLDSTRIFTFNRGHLFLGGERTIVLLIGLLSVLLILVLQDFVAAMIGVVIWIVSIPILQLMAKHDEMLSSVYMKYKNYSAFYPAHGAKNHGVLK